VPCGHGADFSRRQRAWGHAAARFALRSPASLPRARSSWGTRSESGRDADGAEEYGGERRARRKATPTRAHVMISIMSKFLFFITTVLMLLVFTIYWLFSDLRSLPIVPTLTASPTTGPAPLSVKFLATNLGLISSQRGIYLYFGDGDVIKYCSGMCGVHSISHTYNQPGVYKISLVDFGDSLSVTLATTTVSIIE
jgi:hypothetical protein